MDIPGDEPDLDAQIAQAQSEIASGAVVAAVDRLQALIESACVNLGADVKADPIVFITVALQLRFVQVLEKVSRSWARAIALSGCPSIWFSQIRSSKAFIRRVSARALFSHADWRLSFLVADCAVHLKPMHDRRRATTTPINAGPCEWTCTRVEATMPS